MTLPLIDQIRAKQKEIGDLTKSINLWLNTPNARQRHVAAKVTELQDRLLFKLQELELQGMNAKVETMTEQLKTIKGETV